MSSKEEPVELCVIMPYQEFVSMDKRAEKGENVESASTIDRPDSSSNFEERTSEPEESIDSESYEDSVKTPLIPVQKGKKKELKDIYRATQIKKVLKQMEKTSNSKEISDLENLDALIKCALGTSRKKIANEKEFFTFLFENNLGHFVRNRAKINLYYKFKDNWWTI